MNQRMILAAVVGTVMLIISFNLFQPLNNAQDNLYRYFVDGCSDGSNRFARVYLGVTGVGTAPGLMEYNTSTGIFGGPGAALSSTAAAGCVSTAISTTADASAQGSPLYNERGDQVGVTSAVGASNSIAAQTLGTRYLWYDVPQLLGDFQGIIKTLMSLMVILVVAGFLAQAGVGLTQYGMGKTAGGLSSAVSGAVMSLVVSIVVMYLTPIAVDALLDAGNITQTGQYAVNSEFKGILRFLFAVTPLIMIAAVMAPQAVGGYMAYKSVRGGKGGQGALSMAT